MYHQAVIKPVSPEQAKRWLESNTLNRPLRQWHVKFLASEMRAGRFMPTANIHFVVAEGETRLVNGQHTLLAVVESGITLPAMPIIHTFEAAAAELASLYMHYDIGARRTFADAAIALDLTGQTELTYSQLNRIAAALRLMTLGFGARVHRQESEAIPISLIIEQVPLWVEEFLAFDKAISPVGQPLRGALVKAAVCSVALVTCYYQRERAAPFWSQVAHDDGLSLGDPRKTLHEYLPKTIKHSGQNRPVEPNLISRAAIQCWNAYFADNLLSRIVIYEGSKPVQIAGTPLDGNQAHTFLPMRRAQGAPAGAGKKQASVKQDSVKEDSVKEAVDA